MHSSDDERRNDPERIGAISLTDLVSAATQDGPAWSHSTDDLNVNLVVLREGHAIAEHINREVDVLLVGIEGEGAVTIDGRSLRLAPGQLLIVRKGSTRSIAPTAGRVAYLTCHKRRAGLWPAARR